MRIASSVFAFVLVLSSFVLAASPVPQTSSTNQQQPGLFLGTAWYPEQWPESRWETDLEFMQKAGIRFVRVGEFAWSTMEPQEGQYRFEWLEKAVGLAQKHGIYVVLGTPTAAPPAWLTSKYPDTLRIEADGQRAKHGGRQHFAFTSERYRQFCRQIAGEMAKRFGHNPDVIGWQIDNEYYSVSYDPETQRQFQQWLKNKFGTLDSLNQHWTTAYWSETYDKWDEIPIPVGYNNPGLMLEWKRFVSDTYRSYQKNQIDAIHQYADPRQWITHNFMGWFDGFDHYTVSADLDMASWDNYVGSGHLDAPANGMVHDLTRGFKRRNFWVMETQPGNVNWHAINNALDKGEIREMAWEGIGHGAEAIGYWQWRSALGGQEQYHGTLVGPDGKPMPIYPEVAQLGAEFAKAGDVLRGTSPVAQVAILHSYDSRWAIDWQKHTKDYDQFANFRSYYKPLHELVDTIDVVNPTAPLDGYKLVVAPNLNLLPVPVAKSLLAFVQAGGHLVLGPRSGMKDEYNALLPARQPGPLAPALGAHVEQYYALDTPVPVSGEFGRGEAKVWAELLKPDAADTKTIETYGKSNGWLDGQAAVVTRNYGKGTISYVGAWLPDDEMAALAKWMVDSSGVKSAFTNVPMGVEVCRRAGKSGDVFIVINHTKEPQKIALPYAMREQLRGTPPVTDIELSARDVAVLTK